MLMFAWIAESLAAVQVYDDLQAAVDRAPDGELLEIHDGFVADAEMVDLSGRSLTIQPSAAATGTPVLPPLYVGPGASITLFAVGIDGGAFVSNGSIAFGGTLIVEDASLTATDLSLTPGTGWHGIYAMDATLNLDALSVTDATTSAIQASGSGTITLTNPRISNSASVEAPLTFDGASGSTSVHIEDGAILGCTGGIAGAVYASSLADLRITGTEFTNNQGSLVGAIKASDSSVILDSVSFDDHDVWDGASTLSGVLAVFGGNLRASDVSVLNTSCTGCFAGVLYTEDSTVIWTGGEITSTDAVDSQFELALFNGGSVSLDGPSLDRSQTALAGIGVYDTSAFYLLDMLLTHGVTTTQVDLSVNNSIVTALAGGVADGGGSSGLIDVQGGFVTVEDLLVRGYGSGVSDAVVEITDSEGVSLTRNRLCANELGAAGSMLKIATAEALTSVDINNNVVVNNHAGALLTTEGGTLRLINNTFMSNRLEGLVAVTGGSDSVSLVNNILLDSGAPFLSLGGTAISAGNNNLVSSSDVNVDDAAYVGTGDILASDAGIWDGYVSCDPDTPGIPYLALGSLAIDAGDPAILDPEVGTRVESTSDIGATGGPESAPWMAPPDADSDGLTVDFDCDDEDAGVGAPSAEIPDGLDNDCDGQVDDGVDTGDPENPSDDSGPTDSLAADDSRASIGESGVLDADGDGVAGVDDCDDGDASVYPGAVDDPEDGIDQDCDGKAASIQLFGGGCGCRVGVNGATAPWALLFAGWWVRRRVRVC